MLHFFLNMHLNYVNEMVKSFKIKKNVEKTFYILRLQNGSCVISGML